MGASTGSETTAAATDSKAGTLRHDPMAMLPFCGYHMGDYFKHWIEMGRKLKDRPKIFSVNWFRLDDNGKFIWPGYGENMRVLKWIVERCEGRVEGKETPIGFIPDSNDLNCEGLDMKPEDLKEVLSVDKDLWKQEVAGTEEYFKTFGDKLPKELAKELNDLKTRLG
jgi:phosphoenolpyruvate carboxykinase (GTP)